MTRDEYKKLLVLACEADRVAWRRAFRPVPATPLQRVSEFVGLLDPLRTLLPGRAGRWLRSLGFLANLGRKLGRFRP